MITTFKSIKLSRIVNDNIHCPAKWKFVYGWSEGERKKRNISPDRWNEQRVVHHLYEILNRPWLTNDIKIVQAKAWLRHETIFTSNIISDAGLREILPPSSGRTQLIYDNEQRIEKDAEKAEESPFETYISLFHSCALEN